jgi:tetratricopeptide (TPR) repeat protein
LTEARVNYPAEQVLEWLAKLDPDKLSKECRSGPGKDGKQVEYASDEEKWYSEKAKALDKLEKYQESKQVSLKALETLKKCHYDNDIWFNYRIAVADKHLGLLDEAQTRLEKVRQRKKDYFIDLEMAEIAYEQNRINDAIKFASSAALAPGQNNLGFRWKVYFLLSQLFKEKGEITLAKEHALLVWKIRTEQEWKVPVEVESLTRELAVDLSDERSARKIEKGLQEGWKKARFEDRKKIRGLIKTILRDGKSGFIKSEDGAEYYYHSRELRGDRELYDYGIEVEFYCEPASKKGDKDSAIEIHLVDQQD